MFSLHCFHFGLPEIALNFCKKNTSSWVLLFFLVQRSKRFKILSHSMKLASFIILTPSFRQFPFTTRVYDGATQASPIRAPGSTKEQGKKKHGMHVTVWSSLIWHPGPANLWVSRSLQRSSVPSPGSSAWRHSTWSYFWWCEAHAVAMAYGARLQSPPPPPPRMESLASLQVECSVLHVHIHMLIIACQ